MPKRCPAWAHPALGACWVFRSRCEGRLALALALPADPALLPALWPAWLQDVVTPSMVLALMADLTEVADLLCGDKGQLQVGIGMGAPVAAPQP